MSGIFGFVDPAGLLPGDAPQRMALAMSQCADDRAHIHHHGPACLGVVDKGIFAGAGQILVNVTARIRAVFQGEVLALGGKEDADGLAARAYRLFTGPGCHGLLPATTGAFCAAVLDEENASIKVITDRYGHFLVYWASLGQGYIFASQVKAILASGAVTPELDEDGLALMLTIGEVVGDLTLIRGIRALPAGSVTSLARDTMSIHRYWRYTFRSQPHEQFGMAARHTGELFMQAVRRACQGDQPLAVPLSGGLDSRIALAAVPEPADVPSYTWGVPGCRDLRYAERIAAAIGSSHHSHEYDPAFLVALADLGVWLTEGTCEVTDMHVLPFVGTVRRDAMVTIDGLAGDAILGGNFMKPGWWHAHRTDLAAAALWEWRTGRLPAAIGEPLLSRDRYADTIKTARNLFCDGFAFCEADTEMDRAMIFLLDNRVRRCSASGTHLFRWQMEVRFPFYDNAFFDYVASLPHEWRYRHRLYIEMLRHCFPAMADIPWQRTGLPARCRWPIRFFSAVAHRLNDRLHRTVPSFDLFPGRAVSRFDEWLRGPLQAWAREVLLDDRTIDRGLFKLEGIRLILNQHQAGKDHTKIIGTLLAIELFCRLLVDDIQATTNTFIERLGARIVGRTPVPEVTVKPTP